MKPSRAIALLISISILYHSLMGYAGYNPSIEGEALMVWSLILMFAWWTLEDAKTQKFHRPYEFGAFIIFAWPVVLPVYLVATRGWKGITLFPLFVLLYYLPWLTGWVAYYLNTSNE